MLPFELQPRAGPVDALPAASLLRSINWVHGCNLLPGLIAIGCIMTVRVLVDID